MNNENKGNSIKENEGFYFKLIQEAPDAVIVLNKIGNFVFFNQSAEKLSAFSKDEVIGKNFAVIGIVSKDSLARALEEFALVIAGKKRKPFNINILRKKGGSILFEAYPRLIKIKKEIFVQVILRDVSEWLKRESELREFQKTLRRNEAKYRNLFESSKDAIMILAPPDWRFTSGNAAAVKIFAAKNEEDFILRPPWQYSPEYQPQGVLSSKKAKEMIDRAMDKGVSFFEWTHKRLSGEEFPATILLTKVDIDGSYCLQATVRDITERKKKDKQLKYEREQLLSIFDGIDEVIYVSDPFTHEVLYANKYFKSVLKCDPVGKTCFREIQHLDKPCDFCTNKLILKIKPNSYKWEYYNPILNMYFLIFDRIIKWPDGRDVRFELAINITEKKRVNLALLQGKEQYKNLIQTIPDVIYEVDETGKIIFISDAIKNFGYEPDELTNQNFKKIVHQDDFDEVNRFAILPMYEGKITGDKGSPKLFNERRTGKRMTKNLKFRIMFKDTSQGKDEYCWVELHSSGFWSRKNPKKRLKQTASIGIIRDISEQMKAEKTLRKHLKEYEVFYNASRGREERILELKKEIRNLKEEVVGLRNK